MVVPVVAAGAARVAAGFARPVVMGGMKKTMQTTARGGAKVGSRSAIRGSAGTGTATKNILNATMVQDSMSLLENVDQVSKSSSGSKDVLVAIKDGITNLGSIFSSKISGLNSHLAFRLETLNKTMTSIGKVLGADLDLEKKTFDDSKKEQQDRDRDESLNNEKPKETKSKGLIGGMFDGIKGALGGIVDFLTPKSDFMKVGLAGLAVLAVFTFKDKIIEAFETVFTYLGSLKDAFDEGGFTAVKNKIVDDIKTNLINPSLATFGMELKEDGSIGRIPGSFLDMIDIFTGPTNIFKTIKSLWNGVNPDTGEAFLPEWMITPLNEFEWYKGFEKILKTDYGTIVMDNLKAFGEVLGQGIRDLFFDREIGTADGVFTQRSAFGKVKDVMAADFKLMGESVKDFFYDEDGNLFGINFGALIDLLPSIEDIAKSIVNSLPKYLRFDTQEEKNIDRDVDRLKDTGFFNKELAGKSIIDRSLIDQASPGELKSLLSAESDDLKPADIKFIQDKIIEKEKLIVNDVKPDPKDLAKVLVEKTSIIKEKLLESVIKAQESLKDNGSQPIVTVVDSSNKSNVSNYSSKTDQIVEMRTGTLEMTAFELNNFFRTRG